MATDKGLTPLMRQYFEIKANYPNTILLFQVGDFYEIFFDDAKQAAAVLGIALTSRGVFQGEPIPLCGVPLHVLDHYMSKLVRGGFKIVVVDQLELPTPGKVVKRGVTQVLTPGTLTDMNLLDPKSASYLCVLFPHETTVSLLFVELLTGQITATHIDTQPSALESELQRCMPDEILIPDTKRGLSFAPQLQKQGYAVSTDKWLGVRDDAALWYKQFGVEQYNEVLTLLFTIFKELMSIGLNQLKQLVQYKTDDYLMLDAATQRNLELVKNSHDGSTSHTLFSVVDRAVTAMGSRMVKKWLLRPLVKKEPLEERLSVVETFVREHGRKHELRVLLQSIGDLERIVGRIALKRAQLHDYTALHNALLVVPSIKELVEQTGLQSIAVRIGDYRALRELLSRGLNDDTSKEWLVKEGYNAELDRLRMLVGEGSQAIMALELKEQARTGINSLKIRYNQVHGYGIEITNTHLHLVPPGYLRTQTLSNRERFTTQELKDLEYDLQKARTEIHHVEKRIFEALKDQVETCVTLLKKLSSVLAYVDAVAGLAEVAYQQRYVRPVFNDEHIIDIREGRHPVVELRLQSRFIPNNLLLTNDVPLWLITGPNMGGKSTFLRQGALISLLAQIGSFVPAAYANLSIVDRIFTRIGAADNVAEGKSTFLVEMEETALICNQATERSLVILDEVGRGTSTFDGLAIAQSVVEYLYTTVKAHCLFATHYHELTLLSQTFSGIHSYYAASTKTADGIVLLHKIIAGVADGSFGLEVAALAQVPEAIITRARAILDDLTVQPHHPQLLQAELMEQRKRERELYNEQKSSTQILAAELLQLDCEQITPKQALDYLWRLKERIEESV